MMFCNPGSKAFRGRRDFEALSERLKKGGLEAS